MKKKNMIKVENTKIEDLTNELEIKEDGGKIQKKTTLKTIIEKAKNTRKPSLFRIAIDELNEDTRQILDKLWDWGCIFIVTSRNTDFLSKANFEYMNRSYSMGRYFYVNSADQIYQQPCDLLVLCKENYDSFSSFSFCKETIKYYKD